MSDGTHKHSIPRLIDPRKYAQQGKSLRGQFSAIELKRLTAAEFKIEQVTGELYFSVDEQKLRVAQGIVDASIEAQCQRCLEPVKIDVHCDVWVAVVRDEEAGNQLPSRYEPWIVASEEADVYELIQDEIFLNMPFTVYHDYECATLPKETVEENVSTQEKPNPFQALKSLKNKP